MDTRWWTRSGYTEWIKVDLGSTYKVSKVVLKWHSEYAREYEVRVGTSSRSYRLSRVYETNDGNGGTDTITFSARDARYVYIRCTRDRDNGYSLWEFEVYE